MTWLSALVLVVGAWGLAIRQLALEWTINPQYQYGWIVPLLALILWQRAWKNRPAADRPILGAAWPGLFLLAALAVPVRIVQEANPDWRLLDLYFVAQAITVTALIVDFSGGGAWLRHFAFPLLFPLLATPWPTGLETGVIQHLQRDVVALAVEGVSWLGWNAVQRGNLIVLAHGVVGVNEACSGIRSLQSSLMIAFFLGDFFALAVSRRVALVVLALGAAFVLNTARVFILIGLMTVKGSDALHRLHDPAGFTIVLINLLALWAAATLFARGARERPDFPPSSSATWSVPPGWVVLLLGSWVLAEVASAAWYHAHERTLVAGPTWTVRWPVPLAGFTEEPIDDQVRTVLRYDTGHHGAWRDSCQWDLFFFTWKPGRAAAGLAEIHQPDVCLPAAGFLPKERLPTQQVSGGGMVFPMTRYVFQDPLDGHYLYVFQIISDDRVRKGSPGAAAAVMPGRLEAAWEGIRNPGQRSILIVVQAAKDQPQAEAGVRALLENAIAVISPGGTG
jgi:exosortase